MRSKRSRTPTFRLQPIAAAVLCGGAWAGLATTTAVAQSADTNLDAAADAAQALPPITVQGEALPAPGPMSPKFTAPLVDTPQTLSIIPQSVYREQGAQDLTDVLSNTPSISFSAGENGFSTNTNNFQMRGFDSSGNIFFDGARDSGSYSRDIFNVEQVEVAKGPAADNGRGGAGGYVNLVTKTAKLEDAYSVGASYGFDEYDSDARLRATADLNKVLGATTAARLNLLVQDGGVAGRDLAEARSFGLAPTIGFGLGTATRVIASYQYLKQEDRPDWGVPAAFIDGMMRFDPASREDDRDNFYGLRSDYDDVTSNALLARIEHDLSSDLTISNQTRWGQTERDARYTVPTAYAADTQQVTTQTQFFARETESLTNLTNLSTRFATGSLQHSLAAGLELTREQSDSDRFPTLAAPGTDLFNPDPDRAPGVAPVATQTSAVRIDTIALYAYDTVQLNEQWQLTGGLRGERYTVELDSRNADGTPQSAADDFRVSETTLSGKLGVVYKPAENGSLYAAVGLSALPPGSFLSSQDISREGDNAFPGLGGQNSEDAKVQRAINLEVGAKWEFFGDRLLTTVALFQTERRNVAISGRQAGETVTTLQGYGKQIVQGIELSAAGKISDAWSVFAGVGILDSERKHSQALDEARCRANPTDYQAGATADACPALVAGPLGTNGDQLAFTPKFTANLWTTYRFANSLTVGGGVRHVDDSVAGRPDDADRIIPNGNFGDLPGYTVINAVASYDVLPQLTLRLNIDNLTDELYAVSSNWAAQRVTLGAPRAFLLSADYRF